MVDAQEWADGQDADSDLDVEEFELVGAGIGREPAWS